jgi:hypothetical protein
LQHQQQIQQKQMRNSIRNFIAETDRLSLLPSFTANEESKGNTTPRYQGTVVAFDVTYQERKILRFQIPMCDLFAVAIVALAVVAVDALALALALVVPPGDDGSK